MKQKNLFLILLIFASALLIVTALGCEPTTGGCDDGNNGSTDTDDSSSSDNGTTEGNFADNGGVENGLTNWSTTAGALTRTTIDKHSGSASALISERTAYWNGVTFNLGTLTNGNTYDVSVWVKLAPGSTDSEMYLTAKRQDDSDTSTYNEYERVAAAYANANGWTQLQGSYTQSGTPFQHFIIESENDTVSYYVDDFSIVGEVDDNQGSGDQGSGGQVPHAKFVGNITHSGRIPSDFANYWDQITCENEGKWSSAEPQRDQMNWSGIDRAYNYAKQHGMPYKQHTFVWGSQYPNWMNNISASEQKAEVEEWIRSYCQRYPDTQMIDVVNEPDHKTPPWSGAIGGRGATGHDWIIWSFEKARQYCPDATLILNDYNVLRWDTDNFVSIAKKVKARGLLDAVGCQAHGLESQSFSELQSNFNKVKSIGVPIYISEYDVDIADDNRQRQVMSQQFPLFYEDPQVAGITLWGYIYGQTWIANSGLIRNGSPRPAMNWLMDYLSSH